MRIKKFNNQETEFDFLPTELVGVILSFCEEKEKVICKQINRTFYNTLINIPSLCIGPEIYNMEVLFGKEMFFRKIEDIRYSFENVKDINRKYWKKFKHIKLIRFSNFVDFEDLIFFLNVLEGVGSVIISDGIYWKKNFSDIEVKKKIDRQIVIHRNPNNWKLRYQPPNDIELLTPNLEDLRERLRKYVEYVCLNKGHFCYLCKRKNLFKRRRKPRPFLTKRCTDCKNIYCEDCLFDSKDKCKFKYSNYEESCCFKNMSKFFKCNGCWTMYNIAGTVMFRCSVCKGDTCAKCMRFCENCKDRICCKDICKCGANVPPLLPYTRNAPPHPPIFFGYMDRRNS